MGKLRRGRLDLDRRDGQWAQTYPRCPWRGRCELRGGETVFKSSGQLVLAGGSGVAWGREAGVAREGAQASRSYAGAPPLLPRATRPGADPSSKKHTREGTDSRQRLTETRRLAPDQGHHPQGRQLAHPADQGLGSSRSRRRWIPLGTQVVVHEQAWMAERQATSVPRRQRR